MKCRRLKDRFLLVQVFFSVLMGAMQVGQSGVYVEAFAQGQAAASSIFDVIDRVPPIDSASKEGKAPKEGAGNFSFRDVRFNYPSRKDVKVSVLLSCPMCNKGLRLLAHSLLQILQGLSLDIRKGQTVALVGPSGCGKSTVIQLVQRFYDVDSGSIQLEGDDIRSLNVGKLRDRIGIVGQEPVLFGCSIAENIRYGRDHVTDDEIEQACKDANAYAFIMRLPKVWANIRLLLETLGIS